VESGIMERREYREDAQKTRIDHEVRAASNASQQNQSYFPGGALARIACSAEATSIRR
jgi:hypothetical protein